MKILNKVPCPHCLGVGTYMEAKDTGRGFQYVDCKLCEKTGKVLEDIAEDYQLSLNEEFFDDE